MSPERSVTYVSVRSLLESVEVSPFWENDWFLVFENVHKTSQLTRSVLETPRSFACRSSLVSASRIIPSFA